MTALVITVFLLVYVGMIFGGLPFLQMDRTGIALLGAIALVASQVISVEEAFQSLHSPTLILLFAFMVISAQLRLGGFYSWIARRIGSLNTRPPMLLGAIIGVAAYLSAVFSNDVVCLAMAPAIAEICLARKLNPIPFLIGLACAANIGSAATLIGNPQNMLIGPPRQNSCRLDIILNLGATRRNDGTIRRSIQEQGGGAFVAAGERQCGFGGERNWSDGANIGTMA